MLQVASNEYQLPILLIVIVVLKYVKDYLLEVGYVRVTLSK